MIKLTENQEMLLRVFKEFLKQEVEPKIKELLTVDEFPFWVRDRLLELGYTRIGVPEEYGGFGESLTTRLLLLEEGCKVQHLVGHLADMSANTLKLLSVGDKKQIETYLPRIIDEGTVIWYGFHRGRGRL